MAAHLSFLLVLTGLTGIQSITTVSKVSVKAGDSISIPCLYSSRYRGHVKFLCRGYYWNSCSYAVKTNQQGSGKFSISDDKEQRVFTVTVKDLTFEDNDYWCAVEIDGGADVREYFQLSVTGDTPSLFVDHQEITGLNEKNITINCYHRNSGEMKWCKLGSSCVTGSSGSIDGTRVTIDTSASVFSVTMSGLKADSSGWYWCVKGDLQMPVLVTVSDKPNTTTNSLTTFAPAAEDKYHSFDLMILIIPLSLLVLTVIVAMFVWFMLKRRRRNKEESSAPTTFAHSALAEDNVTYSTVISTNIKSSKQSPEVEMKSDAVIYSSIVTL